MNFKGLISISEDRWVWANFRISQVIRREFLYSNSFFNQLIFRKFLFDLFEIDNLSFNLKLM